MNQTKKYRLLEFGERIREGDEFIVSSQASVDAFYPKNKVGDWIRVNGGLLDDIMLISWVGKVRRPIYE